MDEYADRLSAALKAVVRRGPPIPRRNFARPKTTLNYTEGEVRGILDRVLTGVRDAGGLPVTLLRIMGASKQVDDTQAVWFDICATIYDVDAMVAKEVVISVVVPHGGNTYVTKCEPSSRNTFSDWAVNPHDASGLAPFREAGT